MDTDMRYFEPASRVQLASKLRHLLRFSDLMMLIIGEDGSGRSTVLKQLETQGGDTPVREGVIQCDSAVDVTRLLKLLTDAYGIDCPEDVDNRQRLKQLHLLGRSLHEAGVPLVLLIDDADYLTNNALELLTNFALLEDAAPRVVLTGSPEFEQRFLANELDQLLDGRLHVQLLGAFDDEEAQEFVESLLPSGGSLPKRRLQALIEQSEAYPGRLYRLVQNDMHDGKVQRPVKRAFPLPPVHMAAIAAVLVVIFAGALWLFIPSGSDDEAEQQEVARVELPLDIPVASPDEEPEVIEVRSELSDRLAEQEARLEEPATSEQETAATDDEVAATEPVEQENNSADEAGSSEIDRSQSSAPVVTEAPAPPEPKQTESTKAEAKETQPQQQQAAQPKAETASPRPKESAPSAAAEEVSGSDDLLRTDELLRWPDDGYTLQLLGARSVDSIERFIGAQGQPERFYYFRTMYKGAPWHVVVYGQFATRESAMAAVQTLPEDLRKLRPWARSIAGVKSDIRK
ncbi:AAA family ATPase [Marinobacterium lutimaris]|uniref:Sporulation related domain-containing protein n=1 Tax=Marinobacterium lutimaris TaxID=568106 RepID=A0A1H6D8M1_9GAMM|nr:AAA family ATPase [Marinobacterium lutimaris]SEG81777.1 Sporulation related domain-containing protein [Marinobacterium lutimaris]